MKEIRRIYVAQKKKEVCNHFTLVGMAMALMSALAIVTGNLERLRKML